MILMFKFPTLRGGDSVALCQEDECVPQTHLRSSFNRFLAGFTLDVSRAPSLHRSMGAESLS